MNYLMQINGILKPGPLNPQSPPPWQLCVCVCVVVTLSILLLGCTFHLIDSKGNEW